MRVCVRACLRVLALVHAGTAHKIREHASIFQALAALRRSTADVGVLRTMLQQLQEKHAVFFTTTTTAATAATAAAQAHSEPDPEPLASGDGTGDGSSLPVALPPNTHQVASAHAASDYSGVTNGSRAVSEAGVAAARGADTTPSAAAAPQLAPRHSPDPFAVGQYRDHHGAAGAAAGAGATAATAAAGATTSAGAPPRGAASAHEAGGADGAPATPMCASSMAAMAVVQAAIAAAASDPRASDSLLTSATGNRSGSGGGGSAWDRDVVPGNALDTAGTVTASSTAAATDPPALDSGEPTTGTASGTGGGSGRDHERPSSANSCLSGDGIATATGKHSM